jgi:hypothetical protein
MCNHRLLIDSKKERRVDQHDCSAVATRPM